MSDLEIRNAFGLDSDAFDEVSFEVENRFRSPDDGIDVALMAGHVSRLMESLTRIGGEVCRLRAEMDGLLDQNKDLHVRFDRLREVIEEKGTLDMDDFELACEVMNGRHGNAADSNTAQVTPGKKIAH